MVLMHHNIPHDTLQAGNVVDIEWSDSRRVDCVLFRCTTIQYYTTCCRLALLKTTMDDVE